MSCDKRDGSYGIIINLNTFHVLLLQYPPQVILKEKTLEYYEKPNLSGEQKPLAELTSRSRVWTIEMLFQNFKGKTGVLFEGAFFEILTNKKISPIGRALGDITYNLGFGNNLLKRWRDVFKNYGASFSTIKQSNNKVKDTLYTSLYDYIEEEPKPRCLLLNFSHLIPTIATVLKISTQESKLRKPEGSLVSMPTELTVNLELAEEEDNILSDVKKVLFEIFGYTQLQSLRL